jgi:hypothetical protein
MTETLEGDLVSDRPMRILVVNPRVGSEAGRLLARDGYDVLELASEDRPRRMLRVLAPELILILCSEQRGSAASSAPQRPRWRSSLSFRDGRWRTA